MTPILWPKLAKDLQRGTLSPRFWVAMPLAAEDFDMGIFLVAPDTLYRDHQHAAPELYAPLTGPHGWRFGPGRPLQIKHAHEPVWNPPQQPHLTKTGKIPFLSLFVWTGMSMTLPSWFRRKTGPLWRHNRLADTVVYNARIRTMDPTRPNADWVLIRDGSIVALGEGAPPTADDKIDAGGRLVLPALGRAYPSSVR